MTSVLNITDPQQPPGADLTESLRAAADFLVRSHVATGRQGSAAHFSVLRGWSPAYPETTGYIVPTLWRLADRLNDAEYATAADEMVDWLLTLQSSEGWFPGGVWRGPATASPSIFNTGQILFGLSEAVRRTGDARCTAAVERAVAWLSREQDDDGCWRKHAYRPGHSPSYYAHVCWPLAVAGTVTDSVLARQTAAAGIRAVLTDQLPNGAFSAWSFAPGKPAFTHTIAYTLQGCIETGRLLDRWDEFAQPMEKPAMRLLRSLELKKHLAGAFDDAWRPVTWYACLTGNCQMASVWMRFYERTGDPRWLNAADRAVELVRRTQPRRPWLAGCRGGIAGSSPLFGRYLMGRYPNWAAKFYGDAVCDLQDHLAAAWAGETAQRRAA
jgi:hypothetical protein